MTTNNAVNTSLSGQQGTGAFAGSVNSVNAASVIANAGAGLPVQVVQGQLTSTTSIASTTPVSTGVTATITPTATTSKILVRAVINFAVNTLDNGFLQLNNGSGAIGVGAAAGSRTPCGAQVNTTAATQMSTVVLEWLDSPSTTSPVTYTAQAWTSSGNQSYINRSVTDTNNATEGRTVSTITLMEIK